MTEMVRIIYQEMNERLEGEGSKLQKEGQESSAGQHDEDKSKKGNGGNGGNGGPPYSPSSSSSSSTSSSVHQPHKSKSTRKSPLLKLDVKFELPMFNGEVNAYKINNWIRKLEVYLRIHNLQDDDTKIRLASLRMEDATLVWWESNTKEETKKHVNIILS